MFQLQEVLVVHTIYQKQQVTANTPTVSVTNGSVTPSVGGTITDISTTTAPTSGTNGTDYWTIDPGASIGTQPKATPTYTYSATAGYTPAISSTTKNGSATNVTPTINGGTNRYISKATFSSGSGTATLTVAEMSSTISGVTNIAGSMSDPTTTKPTSGYAYAFNVSSSGSGSGHRCHSWLYSSKCFNRNSYSF